MDKTLTVAAAKSAIRLALLARQTLMYCRRTLDQNQRCRRQPCMWPQVSLMILAGACQHVDCQPQAKTQYRTDTKHTRVKLLWADVCTLETCGDLRHFQLIAIVLKTFLARTKLGEAQQTAHSQSSTQRRTLRTMLSHCSVQTRPDEAICFWLKLMFCT